MCGENGQRLGRETAAGGSSPRVRGKPSQVAESMARIGLIPACAGKTGGQRLGQDAHRAHPRVCGENLISVADYAGKYGSSPRVRGKRAVAPKVRGPEGLIPACAGKTMFDTIRLLRCWAHPRVCGENARPLSRWSTTPGSSPRVRGKLGTIQDENAGAGLIPACAGKTAPGSGRSPARRAHPRVCGENAFFEGGSVLAGGSSPRVRGKRALRSSSVYTPGLIPACAGKTGETLQTVASQYGSSPRVRGKHARTRPQTPQRGLIPACAGKTSRRSSWTG